MPKSHVVTIDLRGMAQAVTSSRKGEVSKEGALHRVVSISGARASGSAARPLSISGARASRPAARPVSISGARASRPAARPLRGA